MVIGEKPDMGLHPKVVAVDADEERFDSDRGPLPEVMTFGPSEPGTASPPFRLEVVAMSDYLILTIILALAWVAIGVVLSVVMGRRGHISVGWGVLGAMLGPLAVAAALGTARHEQDEAPMVIAPVRSRGGPVDVLVGIDGSTQCQLAVERTLALFGSHLGRICLATVVPFEDVPPNTRRALAELHRQARLSGIADVGEELLHGPPAQALREFAVAGGYDLLALGGRGRGLSNAVLGSTATALSASCPVPVLIVSAKQSDSPVGVAASNAQRR